MTEQEWLTSDDPIAMQRVAVEEVFRSSWPDGPRTARKRTLFCLACCRLIWPLIAVDDRPRKLVERYERDVELPEDDEELDLLWRDVKEADSHPEDDTPLEQMLAASVVYDLGDTESTVARLVQSFDEWGDARQRTVQIADLLRCIIGNPFRPVTFDPRWRTETAVALATGIYAERAFDRLPILADALEEAGCDHPDVLAHCRDPHQPHARGCWVVDGVLDKK